MKKRSFKRFTAPEKKFVAKYYPVMGAVPVSRKLRRKVESVRAFAHNNGIKFKGRKERTNVTPSNGRILLMAIDPRNIRRSFASESEAIAYINANGYNSKSTMFVKPVSVKSKTTYGFTE